MILFKKRIIRCLFLLLLFVASCAEKKLHVMSSGGFTASYQVLGPKFSEETDTELLTAFGSSMGGGPNSIPMRLERKEPADVLILASEGLEKLIEKGYVQEGSRVDLASSLVGACVQSGDSIPDISSIAAFKNALLNATSIAYSASASGTYLSTILFPQLGVWEQIKNKSSRVVGERVGAVVARGEAGIGFQQVSELIPIEGIQYIGPIPDSIQKVTMFSAAIIKDAENPALAQALIEYLSSPEAAGIIAETGMVPVVSE